MYLSSNADCTVSPSSTSPSLPSFRSSSFYYKGTQAGRPLLFRPSLCNNLYQGQCSTCNADLQFPIQDPFMLCICTMRIMRYDGTLNCECGGGAAFMQRQTVKGCVRLSLGTIEKFGKYFNLENLPLSSAVPFYIL